MKGIELEWIEAPDDVGVVRAYCVLRVNDRGYLGLPAILRVVIHWAAQGRLFDGKEEVEVVDIPALEEGMRVPLSKRYFAYSGRLIQLDPEVVLNVMWVDGDGDRVFFTKPSRQVEADSQGGEKETIDPRDRFNLFRNLAAITLSRRGAAALFLLAGIAGVAALLYVGLHDQGVANPDVWLFSHTDYRARRGWWLNYPLGKAGGVAFIHGAICLGLVARQLRRYLTPPMVHWPRRVVRGDSVALDSLISSRAVYKVRDLRVRVVAGNIERGHFSNAPFGRPQAFNHPVRAVVLYDKRIELIARGGSLEDHLRGERFDVAPLFDRLMPSQMVDPRNGLALHWEIQLIHDDYLDHELIGPAEVFAAEGFGLDGAHRPTGSETVGRLDAGLGRETP